MAATGKVAMRALEPALAALLVLPLCGLLIVPLPTRLLDLLLTANLAASAALLALAALGDRALAGRHLARVVILFTLFRLALAVSTLRLILTRGDAGEVVRAFGASVVRGDVLAGLSVFAVIAVVQYLVVARGAERVAEVAARFALDALPGQQAAIEADLRSGAIDARAAAGRRRALAVAARRQGALDGAMRFVKGDAVASFVLLAVSLSGGLAAGMLHRNMSFAEAAQTYALLTVGDGLVTQIPALFVAVAAALVATTTAQSGEPASPAGARTTAGGDVLLVVGVTMLALSLVPGLPALPFAAVGLSAGLAGAVLLRRSKASRLAPQPRASAPAWPTLALHCGTSVAALPALASQLAERAAYVSLDLGLPLPAPTLRAEPSLAPEAYEVRAHGLPIARGALPPEPSTGSELDALLAAFERAVRLRAGDLLGLDETQALLDALAERAPALVGETVPKRVDLPTLNAALRLLLAEGVPIGDLREPLARIAAERAPVADGVALAERLRVGLAARLSARYAPRGTVRALLLDPFVEETLADAVRPATGGAGSRELFLEPSLAQALVESVTRALAAEPAGDGTTVLLVSPAVRPHVRALLAEEHPSLPVVSFAELLPRVVVDAVAHVG